MLHQHLGCLASITISLLPMNPLKSIRDAWKKWPASARVSVSAATFFAATSAFTDARTLFKDVFASPEKQLTELGYH